MMQLLLSLVFTSCVLTVLAEDLCYIGACDPGQTCCETVFDQIIMCCQMPDAVCCYGQILCCPKGFVCGPKIGTCLPTREYLDNIDESERKVLERYMDDINKLEKRQGLPAELRYLDTTNELEKRQGLPDEEIYMNINELKWQGLPAEERYLGDVNELEKRQGLPAEDGPFLRNRCDDRTVCPYDSTCCLSPDGTYGCCPYLYATCCPDKVHCCPHNKKCDATSRYCIGEDSTFPSKAQGPAIVIDEE